MTATLHIGQYFAVLVKSNNNKRVEYYILSCQRTAFQVWCAFSCTRGTEFEVGDDVAERSTTRSEAYEDTQLCVLGQIQLYIHSRSRGKKQRGFQC